MNFGILESQRMCWQEVLAIGKTVVHDGRRCHIAGMTRGTETKLYIIEPFQAPGPRRKGVRTHRRDLKETPGRIRSKFLRSCFAALRGRRSGRNGLSRGKAPRTTKNPLGFSTNPRGLLVRLTGVEPVRP